MFKTLPSREGFELLCSFRKLLIKNFVIASTGRINFIHPVSLLIHQRYLPWNQIKLSSVHRRLIFDFILQKRWDTTSFIHRDFYRRMIDRSICLKTLKGSAASLGHRINLPTCVHWHAQGSLRVLFILRAGNLNNQENANDILRPYEKERTPGCDAEGLSNTPWKTKRTFFLVNNTYVSNPLGVFTINTPTFNLVDIGIGLTLFTLVITIPWTLESFPACEK